MGKVAPLAVLTGAIIDFGTTLTSSLAIMICVTMTHRHRPIHEVMHTTLVYALEFVAGCGCSVIGAYIAGALAKRAQILNGLLSAILPALLSSLLFFWRAPTTPRLWLVLGIIATPINGFLGGWLALLQARGREVPS